MITIEQVIILVCWAVFALFWLVSAFFVKRSVTRQRVGFAILWRIILFLAVIVFLRINRSAAMSLDNYLFRSSFSIGIPGAILAALGVAAAIWARVSLGSNWSGYTTYKENHTLVTTGPYGYIRHPIYSSLILMFIGTFLVYGSYFIGIIFLALSISFIVRAFQEEKLMLKIFGKKYSDYMKTSKRLIPFVY